MVRRWLVVLVTVPASFTFLAQGLPMARILRPPRQLPLAPRMREAAARLSDQARESSWTHEQYLAAVLSREVSAREASGAELRIRGAGLPGRKSLEDFNFDHQSGLNRETIAHLSTATFIDQARNLVLLGPRRRHHPQGQLLPAQEHGHRHTALRKSREHGTMKDTTRGLHFDRHNRPTFRRASTHCSHHRSESLAP